MDINDAFVTAMLAVGSFSAIIVGLYAWAAVDADDPDTPTAYCAHCGSTEIEHGDAVRSTSDPTAPLS